MKANSWQKRLDRALLDIDRTPRERARLLRRALGDPKLADDVRKAFDILQDKGTMGAFLKGVLSPSMLKEAVEELKAKAA